MGKLKGAVYGITVNGAYIPCELDCEITLTSDLIDKSSSSGGKWRHYRYGYNSWSMSANCNAWIGLLNSASNNLLKAQMNQVELEVYIEGRQTNVQGFKAGGRVLIETQQLTFPNSGFATHTITFKGTGEFHLDADEIDLIINAQPYNATKDIIYNTTNW